MQTTVSIVRLHTSTRSDLPLVYLPDLAGRASARVRTFHAAQLSHQGESVRHCPALESVARLVERGPVDEAETTRGSRCMHAGWAKGWMRLSCVSSIDANCTLHCQIAVFIAK